MVLAPSPGHRRPRGPTDASSPEADPGRFSRKDLTSRAGRGALTTADRRPQTADRRPQTADRRPQTADRRPQTADRRPQTADRRPQTADRRPQTADRRPQTADRRPQTADRRPQTADRRPPSLAPAASSHFRPGATTTSAPSRSTPRCVPFEPVPWAQHAAGQSTDRLRAASCIGALSLAVVIWLLPEIAVAQTQRLEVLPETLISLIEGETTTFAVRLPSQPAATVTVAITGHELTRMTLDKTSLTFTRSNWNIWQVVTASIPDDNRRANIPLVTLDFRASPTGNYAPSDLSVSIRDNTFPGLVVRPSHFEVSQGGSVKQQVRLVSQPTATVTATVTATGHGVTTDKTRLTFTTSDWNLLQTVTVSAAANAFIGGSNVEYRTSGGNYQDPTIANYFSVVFVVADSVPAALLLSPSSLRVAEGGDASYTVKLSAPPSGSVTVATNLPAGTDLTLDAASLTFTTSTWNTAQTVTVSAAQDDDAVNDTATLLHTASGGGYGLAAANLQVAVIDDDATDRRLLISPPSLRVAEGGSNTYTVRLATQPTAQVTVAIAGQASTDLSLDSTSLTFTTSTWDTAQTVTVTASQDDDAVNDSATLTHTAAGGDYGTATGSVAVTVTDDDATSRSLMVSPSSLAVAEGGSNTYTVRLATQPTAQVTVAITGTASTDLTLDAASLTFTTSTWSTVQTVTVSAAEDDDAANDAATLLHTASGGDYAGETAEVAVTVTDDDTAGLTLSTATLGVAEGGDAEYTVRLATQPTAEVTVAVTGQASTDLTLSAASLTFTTSTWSTAQTVTVSAAEDIDAANDAATLLHTASGGDYAGETAEVAVTVTDDDTPGTVVLSPTALGVAEGGDAEYTVRLSSRPTAEVTVAVTGTAGTDLTLDAASLTFTTSTWNAVQTVTVSAAQDDDAVNDAATLLHTASGGNYGSVTGSLGVTVTDDDTAALTLSTATLGVAEGDDAEYTVRLATQPTATVTVAVTGQASTDLTLSAASLTFTTSTWNTVQTVTVSAAEDIDAANDAATLLHTASGGDYAGETAEVAVTVTDDDTPGTVVLSPTALGVAEGGDAEYTVRLSSRPTAEVTVAVTGTAGTDLTLDAASLTFTTSTWNAVQTVTVSAAQDDDAVNDAATLLHTASGGNYGSVTGSLGVTVTDDDTAALTLSTATLGVGEGGDAEYTVRLATQPTAQVTVAITGQASTDLTLSAASLTFTTSTWSTAQTVTVSAAEDIDAANDAATLLHTASGGDYAGETAEVAVTVTDDDTPGTVVLSPTALGVAEGGDAEYTVRLSSRPTAEVTVAITGQASTDLTLDTASLTFTTSTWNTVQTVTVSAAEDDDAVNDAATLLHTASGGNYGSVTGSLGVTVTDDDTAALTLSTATLGVGEGDDAEYTVRLATQPTAQVTVAITGQASTDLTLSAASLTFTTSTWSTAQTVTVSAAEDIDAANDAATLLHTASGGDYAGETAEVAVTVTDDDTPGTVVLSPTALVVAEGADAEYTVRLSSQPTATVTVAITGQASTDLTLDTASLTFTTVTWNTVQTVTVSAAEDDDAVNDAATLLHTASGGNYGSVTGEPRRDGDRRRHGGADAVDRDAGGGRGGRRRVHGSSCDAADGDGDGRHHGSGEHGPDAVGGVVDVHDIDVEHGADGDGVGGRGHRRGERRGDAAAHGVGGRLRGRDGGGCGDGDRRRHAGDGGAEPDGAGGGRGGRRRVHGASVVAADGGGDGGGHGSGEHGPDAGHGVPDVHDVDVEHGADGDGVCGPGRRCGERRGDASAHGVGRELRLGDGEPRRDGDRRRHGGADAVDRDVGGGRRGRRRVHGASVVAADGGGDGCGDGSGEHGPDAVGGVVDVHDVDLEHGADGDGLGGRGHRRGERRGDAAAHGVGGRLRGGDGGGCGDGDRRRHAGDGGAEPDVAECRRGGRRGVHGASVVAADGGGDGGGHGPGGHGPDAGRGVPDVHDVDLEHGADGDGVGGRGRRRGERRGDAAAHGLGRELRLGDGEPRRDGDRRRHGGADAVDRDVGGGRRGRRRVHGSSCDAADGDGDGDGDGSGEHGPDAGCDLSDVHDVDVEHGADGDGLGGRGQRCGERHGDAAAHGVGRRLRGRDGRGCGDGDRRRHGGADAFDDDAGRRRGGRRRVHGASCFAADGDGDGGHHGPGEHGPVAGCDLPDVHDIDLEHGADGDGVRGRGRRRGERHGDAAAHGVGGRLHGGDGERFGDGDRRRHRGPDPVDDGAGGDRRGRRGVHGSLGDAADGDGDGCGDGSGEHGPDAGCDLPDVHDVDLEHGADGDGLGRRGRRRGERHGDAAAHGFGGRLRGGDGGGCGDGDRRRVGGPDAVDDGAGGDRRGRRGVHGSSCDAADGDGDGCNHGPSQHGPDAGCDLPDVHDIDLEHGADGDGVRGRGRRRGERHGDAAAHGFGGRLRGGDGGGCGDGDRRRDGGPDAVDRDVGGGRGGRRGVHGAAVVAADGDGDGCGDGSGEHGPDAVGGVVDVHDIDLEHGADGDGLCGRGRRCGERHGDAAAHGFGGRLRGGDGRGCGDGDRRRVGGPDAVDDGAGGDRGGRRGVHGSSCRRSRRRR